MFCARHVAASLLAVLLPTLAGASAEWAAAAPSALAPLSPDGEVCGTIAADTTWGSDGSPWTLTCKIRVEPGVTLTISEGARLRIAYDVDLEVAGRLLILGTPERLVTLDPESSEQWGGVLLLAGSGPHTIRDAVFTGGGGARLRAMLEIRSDETLVERTLFQNSAGTSVDVRDASPTIRRSRLLKGVSARANPGGALRLFGSSKPYLDSNRFEQNDPFPMYIETSASPRMFGNRFEYNSFNGVLLSGTVDGETVLPNLGTREAAYHVRSPGLVVAREGSLTFEAGATIAFGSGLGMRVDGTLRVLGEPGREVVFTTENPAKTPGQWSDIRLSGRSTSWDPATDTGSRISHAVLEYAGFNIDGALLIADASPRIENTTIRQSLNRGMTVRGELARPTIQGLHVEDNTDPVNGIGLYVTAGAAPEIAFSSFLRNQIGLKADAGAAPRIEPHNTFKDNETFAVLSEVRSICIEAKDNVWGAPNGPSDASDWTDACGLGTNFGDGQLVSDGVRYMPFEGQLATPYFASPLCGTLVDDSPLLGGYAPPDSELILYDQYIEIARTSVGAAEGGGTLAEFTMEAPALEPGSHLLMLRAESAIGASAPSAPLALRYDPDAFIRAEGTFLRHEQDGITYTQPYRNASGCAEMADDGSWQAFAHPGTPSTDVQIHIPVVCPGGETPRATLRYGGADIAMIETSEGRLAATFDLALGGPVEVDVACGDTVRSYRLGTLNIAANGFAHDAVIGFDKRLPGATVELYRYDPAWDNFFPWTAADYYDQENPQVTGFNGWYGFHPPPGRYRARVEGPAGYGDLITKEVFIQDQPFMINLALPPDGEGLTIYLPSTSRS